MNRPRQLTLLALALLVTAFAATWFTVPRGGESVGFPAKLFSRGLTHDDCAQFGPTASGTVTLIEWRETPVQFCARWKDTNRIAARDIDTLRQRVAVGYASAAAVTVLLGWAFGAGRRPNY